MNKTITILILNWNGRSWLEKFLPSVVTHSGDNAEVLVADNGSTDDSVDFVKAQYPQVRIVEHGHNWGFTEGNNRTLPYVNTPYVVLLNSDVEVTEGWLEPLLAQMEKEPTLAAVQPKIRAYHDKAHFEYAGAAGGYIDYLGYPYCRGRLFDVLEKDEGQYDDAREVFWATGACCMLRMSVLEKIDLFEPSFFAHMEEIDFCWRAQNYSYKVMVEPASLVYHVGGGTLPQGNPRKTFLNARNGLALLYKNLPKGKVFSTIFKRLLLDGVWGARSFLTGDFKTPIAIIKAHFAFYGDLGTWRAQRRERYGVEGPQKPTVGWHDQSIVWAHFVKGKKHFNDL
ncbi:MAG: glycosyltransferase family 2 protein [Bacteroidia bacterium]